MSAKFVLKLLMEQKKELEIIQDLLECAYSDADFMKIIITGDETWDYGYDSEKYLSRYNRSITHHQDPRKHDILPATSM